MNDDSKTILADLYRQHDKIYEDLNLKTSTRNGYINDGYPVPYPLEETYHKLRYSAILNRRAIDRELGIPVKPLEEELAGDARLLEIAGLSVGNSGNVRGR